MKLFAWNRVDALVGWPSLLVTRLWVAVTGLTQFTFARIMLLGSTIIDVGYEFDHRSDVFSWVWLLLDVWMVVWILWRLLPEWEQASDRFDLVAGTLPVQVLSWRVLGWFRPLGVGQIAVDTGQHRWVWLVETVTWMLGIYAVTVYGDRRRPWWQTVADYARALRFRPVPIGSQA